MRDKRSEDYQDHLQIKSLSPKSLLWDSFKFDLLDIQSTLVNSTMHNSILSLIST